MANDEGLIPLEPRTEPGLELLTKQGDELADQQRVSVQDRATAAPEGYASFMLLADTGSLMPPWWSPTRDYYLSREWQKCPLFAGAAYNVAAKLATIPPIIEPRDPTIKRDRDLAENYAVRLYEGSEFGRGWIELAMKWEMDRWCSDNGAFLEVLGEGRKDGPVLGPSLGLANLDSQRCVRTGNPVWPVVYEQDGTGKRYKLHYTRVIFSSQMPSTRDEMHGVGLSWFSRAAGVAQGIVDDLIYKQEKLGRRPKRAILVGKKVDVSQIKTAFAMADEAGDNAGLTRVSVMPVIANPNASDVGIDIVDLASLPDGFDWPTDVNIAMYIIALTGGFPVRWMWPATVVGATKADAMMQHLVGAMSGTAYELGTLALLLGGSERGMAHQRGKFLPPALRIRFDVQDDAIDEIQAGIQNTRSQKYERNLVTGSVTVRVTREQMLAQGEITAAQFREMELADGRTQDGMPVDTLFYGDNPFLQGIDPTDYNEAAVMAALEEAKRASVQDDDQDAKERAREAIAALEWLVEENTEPEEPDGQPGRLAQAQEDETDAAGEQEGRAETDEAKALKQVPPKRARFEAAFAGDVSDELDSERSQALDDLEAGREPDGDKWRVALLGILAVWLVSAWLDRAKELEAQTGIDVDDAELSEMAVAWAGAYAAKRAGDLTATTLRAIARVRSLGPLSAEQIASLLGPTFSPARAELIAITETTAAYSDAVAEYLALLKTRYSVEYELIFRTAEDERVCSRCNELDGTPEATWGIAGRPPLHGRCRCWLEPRPVF